MSGVKILLAVVVLLFVVAIDLLVNKILYYSFNKCREEAILCRIKIVYSIVFIEL
jgi:hypothetical protein